MGTEAQERIIWNYLKSKLNMTDKGAAAMMGNMAGESGVEPVCLEISYRNKYGYGDSQHYTNAVDSGRISKEEFINGPCIDGGYPLQNYIGYGLCQWTWSTRKKGLYEYTVEKNSSVGDLIGQLNYLDYELNNYSSFRSTVLAPCQDLNYSGSLDDLTYIVFKNFEFVGEDPGPQFAPTLNTRKSAAYKFFNKYGGISTVVTANQNKINNLIQIAIREYEKGVKENPVGSNNVIYNTWYYGHEVSGAAYPWCMVFVQWCLHQAGIIPPSTGAHCNNMWQAASPSQRISRDNLQPGDIIMFNFNGNLSTRPSTFHGDHTGIVIERNDDGSYTTIEGNSHYEYPFIDATHRQGEDNGGAVTKLRRTQCIIGGIRLFADGQGTTSDQWLLDMYNNPSYYDSYSNGAYADPYHGSSVEDYKYEEVQFNTDNSNRKISEIKSIDIDPNAARTKSASLLTFPSYVESPFVTVKFGDYVFGAYTIKGQNNSVLGINYPNYITSLTAVKVNGAVNQYTINMTYQIEAGNDPNLLDKIFSKIGYGKIKISYGDYMSPAFIYKEEEAMITNLSTTVDFANSRINYVLKCTSTSLAAISGSYYFEPTEDKPSNVIRDILYDKNNTYKLLEIFPGMKNDTLVYSKGLLKTDDQIVKIEAKVGMDPLSYINYLVTCMTSSTTGNDRGLRDSNYYLTICDDVNNEFGGSYFKITKVEATTTLNSLNNANIYEVDIGYPGDTLVTSFKINNDNSWALLYDYSNQVVDNNYTYEIDNSGNMKQIYAPNVMLSSKYGRVTETQRNWWTQMTQFPITATLEIKGLLRPALLMTYIRINALFFGQRHISSGIYIITKQEDRVDSRGYRTTLSLTRIAGDLDFISTSGTDYYNRNNDRRESSSKRSYTSTPVTQDSSYGDLLNYYNNYSDDAVQQVIDYDNQQLLEYYQAENEKYQSPTLTTGFGGGMGQGGGGLGGGGGGGRR